MLVACFGCLKSVFLYFCVLTDLGVVKQICVKAFSSRSLPSIDFGSHTTPGNMEVLMIKASYCRKMASSRP